MMDILHAKVHRYVECDLSFSVCIQISPSSINEVHVIWAYFVCAIA